MDEKTLKNIFNAYQSGEMTAQEKSDYEADVNNGAMQLPQGASLQAQPQAQALQLSEPQPIPPEILAAYYRGQMNAQETDDFIQDIGRGIWEKPPGMELKAINLSDIPTPPGYQPPPESMRYELVQQDRGRSLGEHAVGTGEALLSAATGATGGSLGMAAGFLKGLAKEIVSGEIGSREAADRIEKLSMELSQALTYAPRSESGQEKMQAVGEALQELPAVAPLVGETAAIASGIRQAAIPARAALAQRAARAAPEVPPRPAPEVPPAAAEAGPTIAGETAAGGAVISVDEMDSLVRRATSKGFGAAKAQEELAQLAKVNKDAKASADRLGIELPADVFSDNEQVRNTIGLTRAEVGTPIEAEWQTTVRNALRRADDVITEHDAKADVAGVSTKVRESLLATRKEIKKQAKAIYDRVDEQVPKDTVLEMNNLRATMADITGPIRKERLSKAERDLIQLADDNPTYAEMMRYKTLIGETLDGRRKAFAGMDQGTAKRIYGAMAQDQLDNVGRVGGEALRKELRGANLLYSKQEALGKRIVNAFGRDESGNIVQLMRSAVKNAAGGDDKKLNQLLRLVPNEYQKEVVASAVMDVTRSMRGIEQGGFGASEYAKMYFGLRKNTAVFKTVMKTLGKEAADVMHDLYEVSRYLTDARARVIQNGKANQALIRKLKGDRLINKVMASTTAKSTAAGIGAALGGAPGAAVAVSGANMLAKAGKDVIKSAGELFRDPKFQKLVVDLATKEEVPKQTIKEVVYSPAFRRFAKKINLPNNPTALEQWLLLLPETPIKAIEQPAKSVLPDVAENEITQPVQLAQLEEQ